MKKNLFTDILTPFFFSICLISVYAVTVFARLIHVNVDNSKKSDIFIIGDSHICQMSRYIGKVSYNATWGAHYGNYGTWRKIWHKPYLNESVKIIKNCLKRHGKCKVVLSASTNGGPEEIKGFIPLVKKLERVTVKKGKKKIRADIFVTSVLPDKNRNKEARAVSALIRKNFFPRVIETGLTSTWKSYYNDDGMHLTKKGYKKYYKLITNYLKKVPDDQ